MQCYRNGLGLDGGMVIREGGEEGSEKLRGHQLQVVHLPQGIQPHNLMITAQSPHQLIVKQLHKRQGGAIHTVDLGQWLPCHALPFPVPERLHL